MLRFFVISYHCSPHHSFHTYERQNANEQTQGANSPNPRKAETETNLSPDGKWKSFPRVPHLIQYIPSGMYIGRVKVGGKIIKQKLNTDVFTTAKLRPGDFIKGQRKRVSRPVAGTFDEARIQYEADFDADHTLKEGSKLYRGLLNRY